MKRLIALGLLGVALSAGLVLVVQPAAKEKMAKVKMVKTHYPSRGKAWTYTLETGDKTTSNTIKNDRVISFIPGETTLQICPEPGKCVSATLTSEYAVKGKQIAIDKDGALSLKTAADIKTAIANSKAASKNVDKPSITNVPLVEVRVLIPVHKIKVPGILRSGTETGQYDKKSITRNSSKIAKIEIPGVGQQIGFSKPKVTAEEKLEDEEHYSIELNVPTDPTLFSLSINDGPLKRVKMRAGDKIDKNTVIRMGHGDNFFILNAPQPTAESY